MSDINEIEAGRESDALISSKVMGYVTESVGGDYRYYDDHISHERGGKWTSPVPPYSTDIAAAWRVVEKYEGKPPAIGEPWESSDPWFIAFESGQATNDDRRDWKCIITNVDTVQEFVAFAESAPLAICRAALQAARAGSGDASYTVDSPSSLTEPAAASTSTEGNNHVDLAAVLIYEAQEEV